MNAAVLCSGRSGKADHTGKSHAAGDSWIRPKKYS